MSEENCCYPIGDCQLGERINTLKAEISTLKQENEQLESRKKFSDEFNAVRWEKLRDLFKDTEYSESFFKVMANGKATAFENPTYAQILNMKEHEIEQLQSALDVAVEALSSMHIDTPMGWDLDNPENVTYEIAIGWHKSNNEKIDSTLDKIKQIRENK